MNEIFEFEEITAIFVQNFQKYVSIEQMKNKEKEIIDKAVRLLEEATGFKTTMHFYKNPNEPDAILKIANNDYQVEFNVEIKLFLNRARLGIIINQLRGMRGIPLLITEYVNPVLMDTMEDNEINFIDAAGNALIKVPPLFIKMKGNKIDEPTRILDNTNKTIRKKEKPFYTATLQTIFTILCNPGIERKPFREIAKFAGVAVGTAFLTLKQLKEHNYLTNQYTLVNKEDLLKKWVRLYPEMLQQKYLINRFDIEEEMIRQLDLNAYKALWGGEDAAATLTGYLRPFIHTVYIDNKSGEFILRNRLKKDPKGNLLLMKKFWNFEIDDNQYPRTTHPILVYADLLATGDPRNIETAKIIYEKYIVRYIKED